MKTEEQLQPVPDKKIFNYACAILARRRYSISEFGAKLEKKFPEQSRETCEVVELFLARKYLDDSEYAELFIREQIRRKPQGLRLIKQKLRQKGISETTISRAFSSRLIDEETLIEEALKKKTNMKKDESPLQQKQKLYRFLASRGFNHEGIMKALKKVS